MAKPRPTWVGITVDIELLKEATVARSTANNFLAAADQTGEAVKEALQRKQALLLGIDATFMLEVSFFANMLGEAGTSRLQQEILRCFPSEDRAVTLVACAQTLTQLASTQLMRFVTKSAQGLFKAVREAVSSLEFGRRPTFDSESTNAAFMTSVVGRLGFFVVEDTEASSGSPSAKVYGAAAMKVKYDKLSAAIAASRAYGLADLEPFQMYAWLITDDMKKEVDTWTAALLEGLGESTAGKGASSSGDAGKGVVKKKGQSRHHGSGYELVQLDTNLLDGARRVHRGDGCFVQWRCWEMRCEEKAQNRHQGRGYALVQLDTDAASLVSDTVPDHMIR